MKEMIDKKNIMTVIKAIESRSKSIKEFIISGGNIPDNVLIDMFSKGDVLQLQQQMPFKIDDAFDLYKDEGFAAYIDSALRRELYRKYLKMFDGSSISIEQIIGFMIRSEIERDELRSLWLGKYYNISKARMEHMKILKHVV